MGSETRRVMAPWRDAGKAVSVGQSRDDWLGHPFSIGRNNRDVD